MHAIDEDDDMYIHPEFASEIALNVRHATAVIDKILEIMIKLPTQKSSSHMDTHRLIELDAE